MYLSGNIYSNGTMYINNGINVALFNDTSLVNSTNSTLNIQNLYNSSLTICWNSK